MLEAVCFYWRCLKEVAPFFRVCLDLTCRGVHMPGRTPHHTQHTAHIIARGTNRQGSEKVKRGRKTEEAITFFPERLAERPTFPFPDHFYNFSAGAVVYLRSPVRTHVLRTLAI